MIVLQIDNSYCQLIGLSIQLLRQLKNLLSFTKDSYSKGYPTKVYLIDKDGKFPTGLLSRVQKFLMKEKCQFVSNDIRRPPVPRQSLFKLALGLTPYPDQTNAVKAAGERQRGIVSACTGFGKSVTMAILIDSLQMKTLVIVPNLELKRQLSQSFLEFFGPTDNITVENIDSPSLKKCCQYDILIIDEAHHVAAKTYRDLNKKYWNQIYHRYFFTATPFRSKSEEQILFESLAGDIIYEVDYHTAVANDYIVPMEAYYIEVPKTEIKGNEDSWPAMYAELVVNNEERNHIISILLDSLRINGKYTLCLVKEIAHGEIIQHLVHTDCAFIKGENDDNRVNLLEFSLGERMTLIGTTGVLGEGIDTKPAEYIIIAGLGKSRNSFAQQIGRGFRKSPCKESCKIIIFKDNSHRWTKRHFKEQCKILLEDYGVVPQKLNI